jgi:hypothetical protein
MNQAGEKLFQLHKIFITAAEVYPDRGDPAGFHPMEVEEGQLPIASFFSLVDRLPIADDWDNLPPFGHDRQAFFGQFQSPV